MRIVLTNVATYTFLYIVTYMVFCLTIPNVLNHTCRKLWYYKHLSIFLLWKCQILCQKFKVSTVSLHFTIVINHITSLSCCKLLPLVNKKLWIGGWIVIGVSIHNCYKACDNGERYIYQQGETEAHRACFSPHCFSSLICASLSSSLYHFQQPCVDTKSDNFILFLNKCRAENVLN